MKRIVILAGNLREANQYCRDKGIRATFAKSSAQVRHADHIIELPGFAQRRDRFSLASSRDSRVTFGRNVEYTNEVDWTPPAKIVEDTDEELQAMEQLVEDVPEFGDLSDPDTQERLKAALNAIGITLKKLPGKKVS